MPKEKPTIFVERKEYANFLSAERLCCLLGAKGSGKTSLLKQASKVYIDLSCLSISPENFAVDYIGSILHSLSGEGIDTHHKYLDISFLESQKLREKPKAIIAIVHNELQKIKPDQALLLKSAFDFPNSLEEEMTLAIDEFQNLLDLDNYPQVSDILSLFLESIKDHKIGYALAGSTVNILKSAFNERIPVMEMTSLKTAEADDYLDKLSEGKLEKFHKDAIKEVSYLEPLIIKSLANSIISENYLDARKALIAGMVSRDSSINSHFRISYENALSNARGATLLKNILKVLSREEGIRLTDVAKRIYRSSPVTKALLERLIEVDIIIKDDKTFRFASPLLRDWCALMFAGAEYSSVPDDEEIEKISKLLQR